MTSYRLGIKESTVSSPLSSEFQSLNQFSQSFSCARNYSFVTPCHKSPFLLHLFELQSTLQQKTSSIRVSQHWNQHFDHPAQPAPRHFIPQSYVKPIYIKKLTKYVQKL